jgi:peptidoglycan/xylan/chitin deacetylase (PgdA/CDA1 family)
MNLKHGVFTVSLDFELYWGMRDIMTIKQYKDNLLGVRKAVPEMLRVFSNNHVHVTWAAVGFLFFNDFDDLNKNMPHLLPSYNKAELSPYKYIKEASGLDPVYHFAPELIELILQHDGQELGTHTLSHYYCLEEGQSQPQFEADILSAIEVAKRKGVTIKSIVFPRNQWNADYFATLTKLGIECFRGKESNWMYKAASAKVSQNQFRRTFRLMDAYLNLSGHNTYNLKDCLKEKPFNFPSSRYLRPYSAKLAVLEKLRLRRIKKAMDDAAVNNRMFHLWWHPHDFGTNITKNIDFLEDIIAHYNLLKKNYGMVSLNMGELCQLHEV